MTTGCGSTGTASSSGAGGAGGTVAPSAGTSGVGGPGAAGSTAGFGGTPTGAGGRVIDLGAGGISASCKQTGEACAASIDCCGGGVCNNTAEAPALNGCHPGCTQSADCESGCCVPFSNGNGGICADAMWCSCGMDGSRCGSTLPACCGDQTCLAGDAERSFYECKKRCTTGADCATHCCVPIPGFNISACLDAMYCPAP